jgi:hypothetical protein
MLDSRQHDIAHHIAAVTAGRRGPAHGLAIAAIERERHPQRLAVVATKLEAVRAPSLVASGYRHLAVMPTLNARPRGPPVKQQIVHAHHAINAFGIHRDLTSGLPLASQQAPHACSRATIETVLPGSNVSRTIASFSSADQRRRRSGPVNTSSHAALYEPGRWIRARGPGGSLLAFARGDIASPIRAITARP